MNAQDYIFYGKCLVDGAIAIFTLAIAGGIANVKIAIAPSTKHLP